MADLAVSTVVVGHQMSAVHWIVYDAYRRAIGLAPWNIVFPDGQIPTAVQVNEAVDWWNTWQRSGRARA